MIFIVIVFFLTRLPLNIVTIYIDITSDTYIPVNTYSNRTKSGTTEDVAADLSSHVKNIDKKMILVLFVNPILQLFSLSNSAINPLCYCVMSHAVKHIFTLFQEEYFFIWIYLGFGFVTFADMTTTKNVCSTRIFNLHGRKVLLNWFYFLKNYLIHHLDWMQTSIKTWRNLGYKWRWFKWL